MLKKKPVQPVTKKSHTNFLSDAVTVNGTFTSDQDVIIAGTIEGDVHVKGLLTLEKKGIIKGKVFAKKVDITGKVEGEVRCEGVAILRKSASISADLYISSLQVESDAIIDGVIHMTQKKNNPK